jgi:hypothetical protein
MLEPIIALAGILICWVLAIMTYDDGNMGFKRYIFVALLGMTALWCLVRFIHWAWMTPFPFVS